MGAQSGVNQCTVVPSTLPLHNQPASSRHLIRAFCRPAHGDCRTTAATEQSCKCLYVCQVHSLPSQASLTRPSPCKHMAARAGPQPQQVRPIDLTLPTMRPPWLCSQVVEYFLSALSAPRLRCMENSQTLPAACPRGDTGCNTYYTSCANTAWAHGLIAWPAWLVTNTMPRAHQQYAAYIQEDAALVCMQHTQRGCDRFATAHQCRASNVLTAATAVQPPQQPQQLRPSTSCPQSHALPTIRAADDVCVSGADAAVCPLPCEGEFRMVCRLGPPV